MLIPVHADIHRYKFTRLKTGGYHMLNDSKTNAM